MATWAASGTAECRDCGREFHGRRSDVRGSAARHARLTGHTVRGRVEIQFEYGPLSEFRAIEGQQTIKEVHDVR